MPKTGDTEKCFANRVRAFYKHKFQGFVGLFLVICPLTAKQVCREQAVAFLETCVQKCICSTPY